jgi:hypothetical protein
MRSACPICLNLAARARAAAAEAEAHVENAPAGVDHRRALAAASGRLQGTLTTLAQALARHASDHEQLAARAGVVS